VGSGSRIHQSKIDRAAFPNLTDRNHRITSPQTANYNCIAWAVNDTDKWWEPGSYWPVPDENRFNLDALVLAMLTIGFRPITPADFDDAGEIIALYAEGQFYTHAARRLSNGKWTSKLGRSEDIEHDRPEDLAGGVYGSVVQFMQRA